jgi:glycerol kinase
VMSRPKYVLALDQGTTSSRAILFDRQARPVARAQRELRQFYPQPGWVEHDPEEIWTSQLAVAREALAQAGAQAEDIAALGLTNQRETAVAWERATGRPLYRAIVWQCRRTAPLCDRLRADGLADTVRNKTGLVLDPYFSGSKFRWLLDNVPGLQTGARAGRVAFGTIDSWLIANLTRGKVHATDASNASRTMLFNLRDLTWDAELLDILAVPYQALPEVRPSSGILGETDSSLLGSPVPIAGDAGDQQAALFGQSCFDPGFGKNTYGTGCFLLLNTGGSPVASTKGLLTTVAWSLPGGVTYALEGSVFAGGATVQWLRDGLGVIASAAESETLARSVADTGGVYLVPAFVGLGAPYWDAYARGLVIGITRGTTRAHLARAALEAIAYQTRDVLEAMSADSGLAAQRLRVDGGASANDFLMQFQADILAAPVQRPRVRETTALGAAYLAGLATGFWRDMNEIASLWASERIFTPAMPAAQRESLYRGWQKAVARSLGWEGSSNGQD